MGKWVKRKLGEVAKTFTGLTYSPNQVSENGILVLRSSNIKDEQLCLEDNVFVSMDIPERAIVHENDILICVRNGSRNLIGKSTFIPKEAEGMAFGAFMTILRSDLIEPRLLLYIWQSNSIQRQVANNIGATINQITNTDFKNFDISYPSTLSEQRRIASILSSADKVIDSTQKLIAKYKSIKQGMMEDPFKPKEGWKKVKLGEVGEINPPNKESIPERFVYVDLESVVAGQLLFENIIVKKGAPSRAQRITYENDVLYQTVRPYQKNNYIHKKAGNYVASTGYALIRCNVNYSSDFVYYVLHTYKFESNVLGLCTGTSYPAIAPNNLKKIEIFVPDLSEQCRIASILSSIDAKIESEEKVLEKYKNIKKGLMEKLLKEEEIL